MTVVDRAFAYRESVPTSAVIALVATGHVLGIEIERSHRGLCQQLWLATHADVGSPERGTLHPSRTPEWFRTTFCGGAELRTWQDPWPMVQRVAVYDALAALVMVYGPDKPSGWYAQKIVELALEALGGT